MKKVIIPGLAAGVVILVASLILMQAWEALIPGLAAEYKTPLFRPWSDPLMMLFFLYPFILGIAFAWLWFKTKKVWKNPYEMALTYFLVASIPGMFVTLTRGILMSLNLFIETPPIIPANSVEKYFLKIELK